MADSASAHEVVVRGAAAVPRRAATLVDPTTVLVPVRVDGRAGVVVEIAGRPVSLMVFAVGDDAVVTIDANNARTSRRARAALIGRWVSIWPG